MFVDEAPENSESLFEDAHLTPGPGVQQHNSDSAEGNVFMLTLLFMHTGIINVSFMIFMF